MNRSDKRREFFSKTLRLIHEKGFKATTMRDIARTMDFEVANIYNYIENKQSLLERYVFEILEEYNSRLKDILDSSYNTLDKLKHIISLHCELPAKKPLQISLVVSDWRNLSEEKRTYFFLSQRKWHDKQIKLLIEKGVEEGVFRECDPYVMTKAIIGTVSWLYLDYAKRPDLINPVEMERHILNFVLRGMLAEESLVKI